MSRHEVATWSFSLRPDTSWVPAEGEVPQRSQRSKVALGYDPARIRLRASFDAMPGAIPHGTRPSRNIAGRHRESYHTPPPTLRLTTTTLSGGQLTGGHRLTDPLYILQYYQLPRLLGPLGPNTPQRRTPRGVRTLLTLASFRCQPWKRARPTYSPLRHSISELHLN